MPQTQTPLPPPRTPETTACDTDSVTASSQDAGHAAPAAGVDVPLPLLLGSPAPHPSDGLSLDQRPVPICKGARKADLSLCCCGRRATPPRCRGQGVFKQEEDLDPGIPDPSKSTPGSRKLKV